MNLSVYIVLAALAVALVSLTGVLLVWRHYREMKRKYDRNIVHQLRMQDCVARELERTRIEKAVIERILRARLPHSPESPQPPESPQSAPAAGDGMKMENLLTKNDKR